MILDYPKIGQFAYLKQVYGSLYFSMDAINSDAKVLEELERYYTSVAEYACVAENNQREFSSLCEELTAFFDSKNIKYKYRERGKTKEAKWYMLLMEYLARMHNLPVVAYYNSLKSLKLAGYFYSDGKYYDVKDFGTYNEFSTFEAAKKYYYMCREHFLHRQENERKKLALYVEAVNSAKEKGIDISSMNMNDVISGYETNWSDYSEEDGD